MSRPVRYRRDRAGAVADARNATDEAIATLNEQLSELPDDVDPAVAEARRSTEVQLGLLDAYRGSRDIVLERFDQFGVDDYNLMVEALLRFVKASGTGSTDAELVVEVDTLDSLARATESASVERALLAHVLKSGDLTDEQRQREAISVGEQDYLISRFVSTAEPGAVHASTRACREHSAPSPLSGPTHRPGEEPDATPEEWYEAATGRIDVLRDIQAGMADTIVEQASSTATRSQIAAGATAVGILVVLAATVALAAAVARSIIGPLRRLRGQLSRRPTPACPRWCPESRATVRRSSATSATPSSPRARTRSVRSRTHSTRSTPRPSRSPASRPCCARTSTRSWSTCPAAPSRWSTASSARSRISRPRTRRRPARDAVPHRPPRHPSPATRREPVGPRRRRGDAADRHSRARPRRRPNRGRRGRTVPTGEIRRDAHRPRDPGRRRRRGPPAGRAAGQRHRVLGAVHAGHDHQPAAPRRRARIQVADRARHPRRPARVPQRAAP